VFLHLGFVIAGAVTVETVFSWPGLGLLTYDALTHRDLPLLQGTFIVLAGAVIAMNVVADLLYRVLDPRVRAS
jgi:peptide/nickel transport system permease protein